MTLLTPNADRSMQGVHAFLIGVGKYPHLKDGRSTTKFPYRGDIGQLSSPYHSVEAFSTWLLNDLNLPGSPLRSLRVLASSPVKGMATTWDKPDIATIEQEAKAWYGDCNKHAGNVALFYFCGHGVLLGDRSFFLAQDFGKNELTPFKGSFDPAAFADACLATKASKQLFLLDACRSTPAELRKRYKNPSPTELVSAVEHKNQGKHQQAELYASDLGTKAYGAKGGPSVFMSSLLASMKGAGAHQTMSAEWVVGTDSLRSGLNFLVKRHYEAGLQQVSFGKLSADFDLHAISDTPVVPVVVRTSPATRLADLQLQTDCPQHKTAPDGKPWNIDVLAGNRKFYAGDATNPLKFSKIEDVYPQYRVISIPCGDDQ
ncbi:MAG: caspase family protein [Alcaligenaceae bacterium]|nr:MAG: caspase family protein [Alcaligenaceae bacterium]